MNHSPSCDQSVCSLPGSAIKLKGRRRAAFTLIETALALGIVAFALVPAIALLPIGLQTSKSASDLTISAQIAQRLAGMVQQTDEATTTLVSKDSVLRAGYYYFDGEGQPVSATTSPQAGSGVPLAAVYAASIQIPVGTPPTLVDSNVATTLYVQIVNDPGHRLHGKPGDTLPLELQGHAVIVPVYFANNGK